MRRPIAVKWLQLTVTELTPRFSNFTCAKILWFSDLLHNHNRFTSRVSQKHVAQKTPFTIEIQVNPSGGFPVIFGFLVRLNVKKIGNGFFTNISYIGWSLFFLPGYTNALVIPAQSRNIIIQEVSGSPNYLALRSASGDYFLNGNWYIQWSGDYDVAGTSGQYSRKHNRETFKTKGPITEDLHVMVSL